MLSAIGSFAVFRLKKYHPGCCFPHQEWNSCRRPARLLLSTDTSGSTLGRALERRQKSSTCYLRAVYSPVQEKRGRQNLPPLVVLNPRVPRSVGVFLGGADEGRHTALGLSVDRCSLLLRFKTMYRKRADIARSSGQEIGAGKE